MSRFGRRSIAKVLSAATDDWENIFACSECGSLIHENARSYHEAWHDAFEKR